APTRPVLFSILRERLCVGATSVANAFARKRAPTRPVLSSILRERLWVGTTSVASALRAQARSHKTGPLQHPAGASLCGSDLGRERLRAQARSHKTSPLQHPAGAPLGGNDLGRQRPSRASALPQDRSSSASCGSDFVWERPRSRTPFANKRAPTGRRLLSLPKAGWASSEDTTGLSPTRCRALARLRG